MAGQIGRNFVCVWKNIRPEQKFGDGVWNEIDGAALAKTLPNGTAPENVATYFCTAEGVLLHGARGFWKPEDYQKEIEFALRLASSGLEDRVQAHREAMKTLGSTDPRLEVHTELTRLANRRLTDLPTLQWTKQR